MLYLIDILLFYKFVTGYIFFSSGKDPVFGGMLKSSALGDIKWIGVLLNYTHRGAISGSAC